MASPADRRAARRAPPMRARQSGWLSVGPRRLKVVMRDQSATGAGILSPAPVLAGSRLTLQFDGQPIPRPAIVIYSRPETDDAWFLGVQWAEAADGAIDLAVAA